VTDTHDTQPRGVDSRRILANVGWRTLADLGSKVASLVLYVVMARKLGATQYGVFTFALAFAALATILANLGQDVVLTREVSRDPRRIHDYFFNTIAQKVIVALPTLAVACAILAAVGASRELIIVTFVVGIGVLLEDLANTCTATFQAYERMAFVTVVLVTERWLAAAVGIGALLLGAGVVVVGCIYAASAGVAFLLALRLLTTRVVRPRREIDLSRARRLLREAAPVGIAMVFGMVLFRVDTAMLAAFKPESAVGNYGVAYRLFEATLFLSWSVGASVYPVMARLSRATTPPLGFVFQSSLKLGAALTLPLAVGASLAGHELVRLLFGPEYQPAEHALLLLAPTFFLYPLCYLTGGMLLAQSRQRAMTIAYGAVAAENILANFALIPKWSLSGAAAGTTISQALLAVPLLVAAQRTSGGIDWLRVLSGPAVASVVAALPIALLEDESVIVAAAVGAVVYCGALLLWERRVYPDDAATLVRFVRRRAT
jgi:O-antigen/teichoic acid export membrane protein